MKRRKNLYRKIYSLKNLTIAFKRARIGKTKKCYVHRFEENLEENLLRLQSELKTKIYKPRPLETFVVRDPKTRKISKSDFRDRVIHQAVCNIIEPIFDKIFICDSYANRKGRGNLKAVDRFHQFMQKVKKGYCLKADIKHYFREVNHKILLNIIKKRIKDKDAIWLIKQIIQNASSGGGRKECRSETSHPSFLQICI